MHTRLKSLATSKCRAIEKKWCIGINCATHARALSAYAPVGARRLGDGVFSGYVAVRALLCRSRSESSSRGQQHVRARTARLDRTVHRTQSSIRESLACATELHGDGCRNRQHGTGVSFEFSRGAMGGIVDQRFDNRPDAGVNIVRAVTLRRALRSAHAPAWSTISASIRVRRLPSYHRHWESFTFLTLTIERPPPDLNARLFRHGYLFARTIGIADVAYVHRRHPNAATVSANHSFVQVPAKCRSHEKPFVDRQRLHGVRCGSIFGCCAFPGFPQSTTPYMRAHDGASAD